jgi:protocatechuate 3,4-dioxygenase beta subunit
MNIYDLGLPADVNMLLRTPLSRRRLLSMGAAGIGLLLAGCGPGAAPASRVRTSGATVSDCLKEIPEETAGPFPADGSQAGQSLNILAQSGIVRSDIRSNLKTGKLADGVPTTIELTLVNLAANCAPLVDHAVYLWHCDRAGLYSMYSAGATEVDYLRGVQATDSAGTVSYKTIFPACYQGRWPHAHFEIFPSLAKATSADNVIATSQLAVPEDVCKTVYGSADGYAASTSNLAQLTLATDGIFSDGSSAQLATVSGDLNNGYTIRLKLGVVA